MGAVDLPLGYPDGKVATQVVNDFYNHFKPKELDDVKVLYHPGPFSTPVCKIEPARKKLDPKNLERTDWGWTDAPRGFFHSGSRPGEGLRPQTPRVNETTNSVPGDWRRLRPEPTRVEARRGSNSEPDQR